MEAIKDIVFVDLIYHSALICVGLIFVVERNHENSTYTIVLMNVA